MGPAVSDNSCIKKLYIVNTGVLLSSFDRFLTGKDAYLPVFAYIMDHATYNPVLFDTGLSHK